MGGFKRAFMITGWLGLALVAAAGAFWGTLQTGLLPDTLHPRYLAAQYLPIEGFQLLSVGSSEPSVFYHAGAGLSQAEARERYAASRRALDSRQYDEAIAGFQALEPVYPGLNDLINLHLAQAYTESGQPAKAQERLKKILSEMPTSPLRAMATYRLGQSYYLGGDALRARRTFLIIRQNHAQTPYAVGSLYYLGLLAQAGQTPSAAFEPWFAYLRETPDGRFAQDIAQKIEQQLKHPNAQQAQSLGLAFYEASRDWKRAAAYLQKAPFAAVWYELGQAQRKAGQATQAVQTWLRGLELARDMEAYRQGLDAILRELPADQHQGLLTMLAGRSHRVGGDYVLWQLAQAEPAKRGAYYRQILQRYPAGDYAPESAWMVMWDLYRAGNSAGFIERAQAFLTQYPHKRATPKVQYWLGKAQEASGQSQQAARTYRQLLQTYPLDYYAFRAYGRLLAITQAKPDPGWSVAKLSSGYPPALEPLEQRTPPMVDEKKQSPRLAWAIEELLSQNLLDDAALLLKEPGGKADPVVASWELLRRGDRASSIRVLRDGLMARLKTGYRPPPQVIALLYPVHFEPLIAQYASKAGLNPYLVQSLMREESYFNEFAVSSSDARGLMQLLPSTAAEVAQWVKLPSFQPLDLFIPNINTQLGTAYLAHLVGLFNGNAMLAVGAYNGGPNAMKRWVAASGDFKADPDRFVENIPYEQTRDYIKKVFASYWNYCRLYAPGQFDQAIAFSP